MGRRKTGGVYKRGGKYWINYRVDGERYFEPANTGDRRQAESLLAERRREIHAGTWVPPQEREEGARKRRMKSSAYLGAWLEQRREAGVRNVRNEQLWVREHIVPVIGTLPIDKVTRAHIKTLVQELQAKKSKRTGKRYSPRTVLHVYRMLATAFNDAVLDGMIPASPCTLRQRRGELPPKKDADPNWRANAVYTRDEVETLLSDERLPLERRVIYGMMLLGGLRSGETTGRRWRDWQEDVEPLGKLVVSSQADGEKGERQTKTGAVREVPVHPALAMLLAEWKHRGFAMRFGCAPKPGDPIVPGPRCKPGRLRFRGSTTVYMGLKTDIATCGLRRVPALRHSMRATFLTLLEADGANLAVARKATHAASGDVVAGYVRTRWEDLCAEVSKLRVSLRSPAITRPENGATGDDFGDSRAPVFASPQFPGVSRAPDAGLEPATNRLTADCSTN